MTLEQLAEAAKLSANHLGKIEAEKNDPTVSTVTAVARGLRVPIADLFGHDELEPEGIEAAKLVQRIEPNGRRLALELLRYLAEGKG